MGEAIKRRGEWWQEQADGSWLKWDADAERWQPQGFPPPPPDEAADAAGPHLSAPVAASGPTATPETREEPTPGYRYEQGTDGTWWARNERTGELHFHDAARGVWRRYDSATMAPPAATTEPTRLVYAGFWERFAAALIDAVIVTVGGYVLGYFIGMLTVNQYSTQAEVEAMTGFATFAGFIGQWVYFAVMESGPKQATLGKMAVGMRVTDMHGHRVGFGKATGRYFAKILSALILLIGFLMIAWTEKKQGLHDQMAGTLVVKGRA